MTKERDAALAIRDVLMDGGSLADIAKELGKLAALTPTVCLSTYEPPFNAQKGLEMEHGFRAGVVHIERLAMSALSN